MGRAEDLAHRRRLRSKHHGEYVAWIGNEIVAHGKNLKEVVEEAKKHGEHPVIEKVRKGGVQVVRSAVREGEPPGEPLAPFPLVGERGKARQEPRPPHGDANAHRRCARRSHGTA